MAEYTRIQANYERTQKLYERLLATCKPSMSTRASIRRPSRSWRTRLRPTGRPGLVKSIVLAVAGGLMMGFLVLMLIERLDDA